MDWSDIRIFLSVARHGSLGAAARGLGLSQPTVGRRMTALERSMGQVLFQRSHTGLLLTEEGHAVMAAAERMEEAALAFERRLGSVEHRLSGRLRITASDWFGAHVLAPALADFTRQHPGIEIELLTDPRLYDLSRREADLAFRITPFEAADVVSRQFTRIEYGVYRRKDEAGATDLQAATRLITMDETFSAMPDVSWLRERFPEATVAFRSNNREAQASACAQGLGLAVLPIPLAERFSGLQRLPIESAPPSRLTWMGYHQDLRHLGRLRALILFLDERFGPV